MGNSSAEERSQGIKSAIHKRTKNMKNATALAHKKNTAYVRQLETKQKKINELVGHMTNVGLPPNDHIYFIEQYTLYNKPINIIKKEVNERFIKIFKAQREQGLLNLIEELQKYELDESNIEHIVNKYTKTYIAPNTLLNEAQVIKNMRTQERLVEVEEELIDYLDRLTLKPENRRKIIAWGVAAAFIFRIIFAFGADFMFQFGWLKILGGVLLIWVINNLRQDFFGKNKIRSPKLKSKETKSFTQGVYQVLIADLTLSFDNVLAVVAASKGNFHLMVIGLLLSVFLIATLASYFAEYIKKHQWLVYLGLVVILIIAIQLIIGGLVNYEVLSINEKFKFLFAI